MNLLLAILGGGLGSGLRYLLWGAMTARFGESFPWGTLLINSLGSFAIGFVASLTGPPDRWVTSPAGHSFLMVGICGGFTTFSAFSLETLHLARDDQWLYAGLNVLGSVALCLVFVWLGHLLATSLNR